MEGWMGKILRVNLTEGDIGVDDLEFEYAREYLGCRGLGSKILSDEVDPQVDPLGPDNKLIFMTGPLTGTGAPCGSRYSVITKSPLNNAIACSSSGGYFGPELKFAGYDGIIFEGASDEPVMLWIKDDEVELKPAGQLWGKSTHDTEDMIRAGIENPWIAKETHVACIGPAGEKLSRIACIINDKHRAAGRSGVGAVMGSKKLKAVVVRGTGKIKLASKEAFQAAVKHARDTLRAGALTAEGLPAFGTASLVNPINQSFALPTNNWQKCHMETADKISGETMAATILVRKKGCFACPVACGRLTELKNPKWRDWPGAKARGEGPEYETVELFGADCGIDDLEAAAKANYICNELGLDTISAASTVACAMELYEKGHIPEKDMGGIKANFGNAEAMVLLTEKMGKREGVIGNIMAEGAYRLAEKYGHSELFMGVKKLEAPAYDPRGMQSMGLQYATANRGACHVRGYAPAPEIVGIPFKTDPMVTEGKAGLIITLQDGTAVIDASGLCLFVSLAPGFAPDDVVALVNGATGAKYTAEEFAVIGQRIWNLERVFNLKAGLTKADDTLPKRLLEEPGGPRGDVCRLNEMLPEYYTLRGWDKNGVPTDGKLKELSLG
ncbi:MAG: aldehyde ferredoxin oxidoreductase family protein [bacterium]